MQIIDGAYGLIDALPTAIGVVHGGRDQFRCRCRIFSDLMDGDVHLVDGGCQLLSFRLLLLQVLGDRLNVGDV